jgi:uncharacterized protein (DUF305 family)
VSVTGARTTDEMPEAREGHEDQQAQPAVDPATIEQLSRRLRRLHVLLTALVLVLALGATAIGVTTWARTRPPAQTSPEVGFARDMSVHHAQAVTMGLLLRNRVPEPFNTLTEEIITGQAEQQGIMLGWLNTHDVLAADDSWQSMRWMRGTSETAEHGSDHPGATSAPSPSGAGAASMPGMASDAELTQLAELRGTAREVLFLQLMLRHHRAGTDMARVYLERGSDEQLRELAQGIVTGQEREIQIMTELLTARNAQP